MQYFEMLKVGFNLVMYIWKLAAQVIATHDVSEATIDELGPLLLAVGKAGKIKEFNQVNIDQFLFAVKMAVPMILAYFKDPAAAKTMSFVEAPKKKRK